MKATVLDFNNYRPVDAAPDQMFGTWFEKLSEYAGRRCYDSLGKGRSSERYHAHIMEVGHLSVYEHCNFRFKCHSDLIMQLVNMPSLHIDGTALSGTALSGFESRQVLPDGLIVTANLRHIVEGRGSIWNALRGQINELSTVMPALPYEEDESRLFTDFERAPNWLSLDIECSRNCSHELVRHGDWTAISQESTRYCSPGWLEWHPLIATLPKSLREHASSRASRMFDMYEQLFDELVLRGAVDKKQARGAARGILPSCLGTKLVFSANLDQWTHIIQMRNHPAADGEIAALACQIEASIRQHRLSN